jgi:DNA-binding NarL/FixJ family response regulator
MSDLGTLTTIVLADPREIVRSGLTTIFGSREDLKIMASVSTAREALEVCQRNEVSVLLLGEVFPDCDAALMSGILSELPSHTRLLLICREVDRLTELIEAGAWGCLPHTASGSEIMQAVLAVSRGEHWVPRKLLSSLIRERRCNCSYSGSAEVSSNSDLTPREVEILELVARGLNNDQIATSLFIGRCTVKTHLLRAFRKLDATDRTSAVAIAIGRKLIRSKMD